MYKRVHLQTHLMKISKKDWKIQFHLIFIQLMLMLKKVKVIPGNYELYY